MLLPVFVVRAAPVENPDNQYFIEIPGSGSFAANSFGAIIMFIISNILLPLVGIISVLFLIIGGFQYVTSRGNEEQAETAKKTLANAIIGLIVVVLSYIIVTIVINALKGQV